MCLALMLQYLFVHSLQRGGLIFCDATNSPPFDTLQSITLIVCSFHGVEWNHPTACGFQKGKHKHGEALVGSWRADRCQNQGESFRSPNTMSSLLGSGGGFCACFGLVVSFWGFFKPGLGDLPGSLLPAVLLKHHTNTLLFVCG